ncbi:spore germination protein [Paenibacillus alba]|uniref:Spore germination protein n=1 Tax=Paenibacillus alba TaxID=1197127 RepID=A0ABU6FVV4_9BACL|nr:spore germination protein [Paenibacillus alba]MEC0226012.1 spore germination protein [Paenibacillus alba]NQX71474.1 spore germination protein [Paenibacillus alba]
MPAVVYGGIKINSVNSGSNVQIGDTAIIRLSSSAKYYGGANSFSPGDNFGFNPQIGNTNTIDPDLIDNNNNNIV